MEAALNAVIAGLLKILADGLSRESVQPDSTVGHSRTIIAATCNVSDHSLTAIGEELKVHFERPPSYFGRRFIPGCMAGLLR